MPDPTKAQFDAAAARVVETAPDGLTEEQFFALVEEELGMTAAFEGRGPMPFNTSPIIPPQAAAPARIGLKPAETPRRTPTMREASNAADLPGVSKVLRPYMNAGPIRAIEGVQEMQQGELAKGAHDIIGGAAVTASPAAIPAIVSNPVGAALAAGAGVTADWAGRTTASALGAPDDIASLVGDAAGIAGGGATFNAAPRLVPKAPGLGTLARGAAKTYQAVRHPFRSMADVVADQVVKRTQPTVDEIVNKTVGVGPRPSTGAGPKSSSNLDRLGQELAAKRSAAPPAPTPPPVAPPPTAKAEPSDEEIIALIRSGNYEGPINGQRGVTRAIPPSIPPTGRPSASAVPPVADAPPAAVAPPVEARAASPTLRIKPRGDEHWGPGSVTVRGEPAQAEAGTAHLLYDPQTPTPYLREQLRGATTEEDRNFLLRALNQRYDIFRKINGEKGQVPIEVFLELLAAGGAGAVGAAAWPEQ